MGFLEDFTLFEMMVIVGTIILLALLMTELLDVTHLFPLYESKDCIYGYGLTNGKYSCKTPIVIVTKILQIGPHVWKKNFPRGLGKKQSPVNIISNAAICVPAETMSILCFSSEYYKPPKEMKIYNDGHTG